MSLGVGIMLIMLGGNVSSVYLIFTFLLVFSSCYFFSFSNGIIKQLLCCFIGGEKMSLKYHNVSSWKHGCDKKVCIADYIFLSIEHHFLFHSNYFFTYDMG